MIKFCALLFLLFLASSPKAEDYRDLMNQGEKHYKDDKFAEAADNYRQAELFKPEEPMASFNTGAALYKSGDNAKAAEKFLETISLAEGEFQSESYYNLGNSLFNAQDYKNAIDAYKNSLMLDPGNEDAKFNYEYAMKKMEEQQQQQQQQKQNQDQDQQDQQEQDKQDQNQQQENKEQEQNQQDKQQKQQDQKPEEQKQQKPQPKKGEMSEEEAKALLEPFKQDEKELQKKLKKYNVPAQSRRDW